MIKTWLTLRGGDASELPKRNGVYAIRNNLTRKVYIGSASRNTVRLRCMTHLRSLEKGNHPNRHLQMSWNKYGGDNFVFMVLFFCSPEHCIPSEQRYIDAANSSDARYGYNLSPTAASCRGVKHSLEARQKHTLNMKKRFSTPQGRIRQSVSQTLRFTDKEQREKISRATKEGMAKASVREKLSKSVGLYARTEESRKRMSEQTRALWQNPEYRLKVLKARGLA